VKLVQTDGGDKLPQSEFNLNDWNWSLMPDHDIDGYQIPEGASDEAGLQ